MNACVCHNHGCFGCLLFAAGCFSVLTGKGVVLATWRETIVLNQLWPLLMQTAIAFLADFI